jgi:sec-independent protein translocase protein TatC
MSSNADHIGTFWEHLDELRSCLIRIAIAVIGLAFFIFFFKDDLFRIVLAPKSSDFVTYRLLHVSAFDIHLMNIGLTEQFMIHLKTAMYFGVLVAAPYIIWQIFHFVSPALYEGERLYARVLCLSGYLMFMLGTLLNYFLIFPLTVKFLGTYQVSPDVANMLTLQSYMDTLMMMNLVMGIVFELPVVSWILGRMGLISRSVMRSMRRHAVVVIFIVAAVITPTTDAFTMFIVALPIWMLYELSILIVKD